MVPSLLFPGRSNAYSGHAYRGVRISSASGKLMILTSLQSAEGVDVLAMRVLVIEDDSFTRSTLVGALAHLGVTVSFSTGSAGEGLDFVKKSRIDAALLDLDLGAGPTGIDVAHALRRDMPEVGIVVLSSFADPRLTGRNLPDLPPGAIYVEKRTIGDTSLLLELLAQSVAPRGKRSTGKSVERSSDRLTDVQVEIMRFVALGLSNAEIAKRRFTSVKAAENSISRLAKQLGFANDPEQNQRVLITREYVRRTGGSNAQG